MHVARLHQLPGEVEGVRRRDEEAAERNYQERAEIDVMPLGGHGVIVDIGHVVP
jgi:hypothetical protein